MHPSGYGLVLILGFLIASWVTALGYTMPIKYYFLIMVDQSLNGIDLYYSRIYYAALMGFTILPMLLSWRLKKECMNPVYVP